MFSHHEDEEEDGLLGEFSIESISFLADKQMAMDAADYFAEVLSREFPGLEFERYEPTEWRVGWVIKVPPPPTFTTPVRDLETRANELQDKLYWDKTILLPYTLEVLFGQPGEE